MFWHYEHYYFVYVNDINTHFLLFYYYYIFVPFSQFWTTSRFKKLIYCPFIWHSVVIFPSENITYQKVSGISWKYWYYFLIFRILVLKFCNTILHTHILLHLFLLLFFITDISSFQESRSKNFDMLLQRLFHCLSRLKRTLWKSGFLYKIVDCWGETLF